MITGNNKNYVRAQSMRGGSGSAMTVEGEQGRWLLAKAQQLKERALGTADRTRRKQFLLIATEYQKLARQEDGGIALGVVDRMGNRSPELGIVTSLPVAPRPVPTATSDTPARPLPRLWHAFRRPEIVDVTIWAILVVISFALLLAPGDQTTQGLKEIIDLLAN